MLTTCCCGLWIATCWCWVVVWICGLLLLSAIGLLVDVALVVWSGVDCFGFCRRAVVV